MNLIIVGIVGVALVVITGLLIGLGNDALGVFRKKETPDTGEDALQILDARLARGEITIDEYNAIRSQIGR